MPGEYFMHKMIIDFDLFGPIEIFSVVKKIKAIEATRFKRMHEQTISPISNKKGFILGFSARPKERVFF